LSVSSGSASFAGTMTLTIPALTVSGGTLQSGGDLTVTGLLSWSGGTMSAPAGTTPAPKTVAQGGMSLSGSSYRILDGRTLENPGTATWTGGDFYLANAATLHNSGLI